MKRLLLFLSLLPLFASAQIPAANDTTLIVPNNPFTPQFRFSNVTLSGVNYRIPQVYNSLLGKYDTYVTTKYLRAFYAPLVGGGYVPTSRALTINGVTQDLSANRTWTINTTPTQASITGNNRIALWNSNDSLTVLPQSYFNYNLSGNYFQSFAEWNLLGTTNMGNTHFLLAPSSGDNPIRKQDTTLYINPTHFNTIIPTATATALAAKVPNTRLVSTGNGILGGGNLGSNLTLTLDTSIAVTKTYANRYYKSGDSPTFATINATTYNGAGTGLTGIGTGFTAGIAINWGTNGAIADLGTGILSPNATRVITFDNTDNVWKYQTIANFKTTLGINNGSTLTNSITGNAATATNSTLWGGHSIIGGAYSGGLDYILGYDNGTASFRPATQSSMQSFLALGTYAYRSSGLAELSGGPNAIFQDYVSVQKNGSDTQGVGANYVLVAKTGTVYAQSLQLSVSGNLDFWSYNAGWNKTMTLSKEGNLNVTGTGVFSGNLSANLPTYSSGTNAPVVYNSTNNRFETSTSVMTNPMTTLGDLPYGGASGVPTRLAGTTDNNRYFLQSKSVGGVATAPSYYDPFSNSNLWGGFQNFIGGIASNTHRFDDYGSGNFGTLSVGTLPSIAINWLLPTHGGTLATTSDIPTYGQTTLTAGVSTITIPGLTTSSIATTGFVSIGGTVSTTWQYKAVCTTNTLTITAITNANTTNTTDTSILNYSVKL